jgi:sporulation protein YlmC with PRC-barrel domain
MRTHLFGTLAAAAILVPTSALAQDTARPEQGRDAGQQACDDLARYMEQNPDRNYGVDQDNLVRLQRSGNQQVCRDQMDWFEARARQEAQQGTDQQASDQNRQQRDSDGQIVIQQPAPAVRIDQPEPEVTVSQTPPDVSVIQPQPEIIVRQPAPQVTINIPQPQITVRMPDPTVQVSQNQPEVQVEQAQPRVEVIQPQQQADVVVDQNQQAQVRMQRAGEANVEVQRTGEATVRYEAEEPQIRVQRDEGQPQVTIQRQASAANGTTGQQDQQDQQDAMSAGQDVAATGSTRQQQQAAATQQSRQPAQAGLQQIMASDLIGRDLVNARGNELGEVSSLVVDTQRNNAIHAIVTYGGFLGVGEKRVLLPLERLHLRGDKLVVNDLSDDQLRQLPDFRDTDTLQELGSDQPAQIRVEG